MCDLYEILHIRCYLYTYILAKHLFILFIIRCVLIGIKFADKLVYSIDIQECIMNKKAVLLGALFHALALGSFDSNAIPIINNVGINNPDQVITFDGLVFSTGTSITNQYSSLGVTSSPGLCYNVQPIFFPTASLGSYSCTPSGNNSIFFNDVVTDAAFALQSNPITTTFSSYLNGALVESFNASTVLSFLPDLTNASNFYGFENSAFNEIRIANNEATFQIDNVQYTRAAVPEPIVLALLSLGLFGIGATGRLRNKY